MKRGVPSAQESLLLLRRVDMDEKIIKHSLAVARISVEIAKRIKENGANVDVNLVEAGAILHDIGRSKVHGLEHGRAGGELLRQLGYSDSLARIAETHVLCGILTDKPETTLSAKKESQSSMTLEEKIVCYADKVTEENKKTTLAKRFGKWFKQYGENDMLNRALRRSKEIESELGSLLHRNQ